MYNMYNHLALKKSKKYNHKSVREIVVEDAEALDEMNNELDERLQQARRFLATCGQGELSVDVLLIDPRADDRSPSWPVTLYRPIDIVNGSPQTLAKGLITSWLRQFFEAEIEVYVLVRCPCRFPLKADRVCACESLLDREELEVVRSKVVYGVIERNFPVFHCPYSWTVTSR